MEELELLRQKLYSIQREDNSQKLSERNCIEIIVKMIELKMVDIIHTLNGKEYITPKQLELEIKDEILRSGGRVIINDLQSLLSIDIIHIEQCIDRIKKRDKSIQIYQGEIMTRYYLDSVFEEIKEQLFEVGKININDLSNRFQIGNDLLTDVIVGKLKNVKLNSGIIFDDNQEVLYTQSHIDRHNHKVVGLFSSITQPCLISTIVKQYQIKYQLNERLLRSQLEDLIKTKRINGIVQGKASNAEYIPNIFSQSRSKWIESFYQQNQYISYDSLLKLQITEPASYLKNSFKSSGIPLHSSFINQSLIDSIDDSITDVIDSSNWLDIVPLLPPSLTNKDIAIIVANCPNMKDDKAIFLGEGFIVSKSFVDRCFSLLQNTIQEKIEKQQKLMENIASSSNTKKQLSLDETIISPTTKKQLDSDDEDTGNKKPNKKGVKGSSNNKGGKKQTKKEQIDSSDEDDEPHNNKHRQQQQQQQQKTNKKDSSSGSKVDHLQEITQLLGKWYENMEPELVKSLSQYLKPLVNQMWDNMVKEVKEKLDNENMKQRKQQQQSLNQQFLSLYNNFLLFKKGISSLDSTGIEFVDVKSTTPLVKHLLKTVATNITNCLIEINANYHMLDENTFETPQQRSAILSQLPSQLSKNLEKLIQSLNKSSIDDFVDILDKVCLQSQIKLKSLDKKSEKQLLQDNKNELEEQLLVEKDVGNQFQIIVNLLYIRFKNHYIFSPPRLIGTLVNSIVKDKRIDKEITSKLDELHQEIVKLIINNKSSNSDGDDSPPSNSDIIFSNINYFKDLIQNQQQQEQPQSNE